MLDLYTQTAKNKLAMAGQMGRLVAHMDKLERSARSLALAIQAIYAQAFCSFSIVFKTVY